MKKEEVKGSTRVIQATFWIHTMYISAALFLDKLLT